MDSHPLEIKKEGLPREPGCPEHKLTYLHSLKEDSKIQYLS